MAHIIREELKKMLCRPLFWVSMVLSLSFICYSVIFVMGDIKSELFTEEEYFEDTVHHELIFMEEELENLMAMEEEGFDFSEDMAPGYSYYEYREELIEALEEIRERAELGEGDWQISQWEKELIEVKEFMEDPDITDSLYRSMEQEKLWLELRLSGIDEKEVELQVQLAAHESYIKELDRMLAEGFIEPADYRNEKKGQLMLIEMLKHSRTGEDNAYVFTMRMIAILGVFLFPFFIALQASELFAADLQTGFSAAASPVKVFLARFISLMAVLVLTVTAITVISITAGGFFITFAGIQDKTIIGVREIDYIVNYDQALLLSLWQLLLYVYGALLVAGASLAAMTFLFIAAFRHMFAPVLATCALFLTDFLLMGVIGLADISGIYNVLPFLHFHAFHHLSDYTYLYHQTMPASQSLFIYLPLYTIVFLAGGAYLYTKYTEKLSLEKTYPGQKTTVD